MNFICNILYQISLVGRRKYDISWSVKVGCEIVGGLDLTDSE